MVEKEPQDRVDAPEDWRAAQQEAYSVTQEEDDEQSE